MLRNLLAIAFTGALALPAAAADYWYPAPTPAPAYASADLPACDSPDVLARVASKAAHPSIRNWDAAVLIGQVDRIRETRMAVAGRSLIDRRYCRGEAWLSNGRKSEVVYLIEAHMGFASIGYKVESCLPAYDPYRVYGAWCHSIR
jgi:hypothetical protein